jgi:hypothetical protein
VNDLREERNRDRRASNHTDGIHYTSCANPHLVAFAVDYVSHGKFPLLRDRKQVISMELGTWHRGESRLCRHDKNWS